MDMQRAWEVQIYPQDGRVLVNLFDRVLIWEYAYVDDVCGCMMTARRRVQHKVRYEVLQRIFIVLSCNHL